METKDIFEQMAGRYDTQERSEIAAGIATAIRQALAGAAGGHAMDYGCGTGLVGMHLVDLFEEVLFVDTAPQMLAQVQKKMPGARTLCGDFTKQVPEGLRADVVWLSQVLLHVKDYPLLLRRLHGVLRPGGHLIVVDFDYNEKVVSEKVHPGFVQEALVACVREIGFASAGARTFFYGEKMFMNEDASLFLLHAVK